MFCLIKMCPSSMHCRFRAILDLPHSFSFFCFCLCIALRMCEVLSFAWEVKVTKIRSFSLCCSYTNALFPPTSGERGDALTHIHIHAVRSYCVIFFVRFAFNLASTREDKEKAYPRENTNMTQETRCLQFVIAKLIVA